MPKLSVALASYNGEKFIKRQLMSILSQTRKPDEVIIIDDCSTDSTQEIVSDFIDLHGPHNWKLFVGEKNVGYRKNFYNCIAQTSGNIVFLCDQDDYWRSDKLEALEQIYINNPDIQAINSSFVFVDGDDKEIPFKLKKGRANSNLIYGEMAAGELRKIPIDDIIMYNISPGCTASFRRETAMKYIETSDCVMPHDWEINILAAVQNGLYFYNEPLINYRIHGDNTIGLKTKNSPAELKMTGSIDVRKSVLKTQQAQLKLIREPYVNKVLTDKSKKFISHFKFFCDNRQSIVYNKKLLPCFKNLWHYFFLLKVETVHFRGLLGDIVYVLKH
ncbi:MAG: glycosyltransferase [Oscillospiraceae bacterium]|nr:glycosyltransferase [Oscillospiraceae bacterium]